MLQYIGNNEEIMDVQLFGSNEEYLALATNSVTVKVYSLADFDRYDKVLYMPIYSLHSMISTFIRVLFIGLLMTCDMYDRQATLQVLM